MDKVIASIQTIFGRGRGVLVATTFASYVLGLFRDRLFAQTFGASRELDAYQAAFLLPDFMLNFLVAGGLTAVFVPLFLEAKEKNPAEAERFANSMATFFAVLMLAVGIGLFIFSRQLAAFVAPGFSGQDRELLVRLMRVLAFSPTIFAVSNAFGAVLVAQKRFLTYGLAPVFYNAGIIAGTVFFAAQHGIMGVAYGTILGAALHLCVRFWELKKLGFLFRPAIDTKIPEIRPFFRLMVPKMFGHPVELATFWGFTAIASTLATGSIAVLNFARNFQSVPISLIGIVFATVSFSQLSQLSASGDRDGFGKEYKRTLFHIFALSSLAAVLIFVFNELIIGIFLGGGRFEADAIKETATLLGYFAISIPLEAVSHLQARAFYATKNTVFPVYAGFINLALSIGGAWLLLPFFGIIALPIGYAIGSLAKVVMLAVLLRNRLRPAV